jgi:methylphosphotriester-DNA--protein-cysteine methyltransferase
MNGPTSAAARWRAIVDRDPSVNSFVYAVRTTRIYCRPSCPARLARRANIEFYDSPKQAEKAGFRSCKRCKPQLHVMVDPNIAIVQKACDAISSAGWGPKPKLHELAAEANLTPSHFHRVFKKIVGVTPGQYARNVQEGGRNPPLRGGSDKVLDGEGGSRESLFTNPVMFDGSELTTSTTGNSEVIDVDPEPVEVDWNEFDSMLASVAIPGPEVDWGSASQIPTLPNTFIENAENYNPFPTKRHLPSSNSQQQTLLFEEALGNISANANGTVESMTELLCGTRGTPIGLEPITVPVSPLTFDQADGFWREEDFSNYQ